MMKSLVASIFLFSLSTMSFGAELAEVTVDDQITRADGQSLKLNGMGLREKFWVDVYVGSLYLTEKTNDAKQVLKGSRPWTVQLDFVYEEVTSKKLIDAWKDGFESNQSDEVYKQLNSRLQQFYKYFDQAVVAGDQYRFDYQPGVGVTSTKNQVELGVILGEDFQRALLAIWLGRIPADPSLKRGMLGIR